MKRAGWVALLLAFPLLFAQPAQAIVYGEPDGGEHPNVGSFVGEFTNPETDETTLFQLCTGTLIDEDVVLSASHCFSGLPATITAVWFTFDEVIDGDQDGVVDAGVTLLTGTPVVHPEYGSGGANNTYDIAVFLLDEPVAGIQPAPLPTLGLLDDHEMRSETFTAVGYGTVRSTNRKAFQAFEPGWRRMQADQSLLSVTPAWATFSMNLATKNGGTCYGDSGGPHFLGDVVVSITVTGDAMCKATDKTYRLDTTWAQQFLAPYLD